jgi:DNA polymerase-1
VNADYPSLEPVCFAHVSNERALQDVFRRGYDLYSVIAIDVFKLTDCSADKKAPNYLKLKYPEKRQLAKAFCLAVVYGAEAHRISEVMGVPYQEAAQIIESYLAAYPELKKYMAVCDYQATHYGFVKTQFGRVRHLPIAAELYKKYGDKLLDRQYVKHHKLSKVRHLYKNALNNAKNFKIQGLAAHIVNRAAIAIAREFKQYSIDGGLVVQVHDELTAIVKDERAKQAAEIVQRCMKNAATLFVSLTPDPVIAQSWDKAK